MFFVVVFVVWEQFRLKFHQTFFETRWSLRNFSTTINDFIKRENSANIRGDEVIFSLESVVYKILKLLHLDFDDDFIN